MASKFEKATKAIEAGSKEKTTQLGKKLVNEGYTTQTSVVMRQSYHDALTAIANKRGCSRNSLTNQILETWIDEHIKELKERG